MESPVRICIGAAIVVNILLITSTAVSANTSPIETTSSPVKNDRNSRYIRINSTAWIERNKSSLPDTALNELHPKDSTSEDHTEKNAKYKDRGRVKFNLQSKATTKSPLKRVTGSTKTPDVIIVTPTPEVKKPAEIISSMQTYKKTKMPSVTVLSTSEPVSLNIDTQSEELNDDEEDKESYEKYTSAGFDDSSFFTIPSFDDDDDFRTTKYNHGLDKNTKSDYNKPTFDSYPYFPKNVYSTIEEGYKSSNSYFDFDSDLTTPKNDFFDKKFHEITSGILNNLDKIKSKTLPPNMTNVHKIVKQNIGFEKSSNDTPTNKSTVFIKNTKEIRFLDNDKAGSNNKGLSDVQGTSIYYEMTVLSTETYNLKDTNDEDCDENQVPSSTMSTPIKEELASIKAKLPNLIESSTRRSFSDSEPSAVSLSGMTLNLIPSSTVQSAFSSLGPIPISTQSTVSSTDTSRIFSNFYNRNRNYSKRLNLSGNKASPNSVFSTLQTEQASSEQANRPQTRRFHYTTPKTKPIWLAPRKNVSRTSYPRVPTTIYSEHFDIKDKMLSSTYKPKLPTRTILTTQSSDIDPVLQSDVSGIKKVVQSQSISDNTIPSLWKRGSTKFSSSTASAEGNNGIGDMEIPPTLTAWALASMRIPPSSSSNVANATAALSKSVDENELQNVGEIVDKKGSTTSSSVVTTIPVTANNEFLSKNITEIFQNKLPWKPIMPTNSNSIGDTNEKASQSISERVPAESNISIQSSPEPMKSEPVNVEPVTSTVNYKNIENKTSWIPVTNSDQTTSDETKESLLTETIPPVDATKSTGFESITKLPAGVTTPKDETDASSEVKNKTQESNKIPAKTDYEITTIRFSYVPTEALTESIETGDTTDWVPVFPTRTQITTIEDRPITTYRPKYVTSNENIDETTTMTIDSTPQLEVSSQIVENSSENETSTTTELIEETTQTTNSPSTVEISTFGTTQQSVITTTESESTTPIETTTIVVTVATEINSERVPVTTFIPIEVTETVTSISIDTTSQETSDSNEVVTQQDKVVTSPKPALTTTMEPIIIPPATEIEITTRIPTTTEMITTTQQDAHIVETTTEEFTTEMTTKSVNDLEDLTSYGDVTTESSSRVLEDEAGSGATIAIAVSTIGVIALILLVGLLLVVRRRGRRGIYAQRCTPVSLDAYSLDSVSVGHRKGNHRLRASKRSYGNPAYDDEVTSHPMQYAALANFAMDIDSIIAEFSEIPSITVRPDEVPPGCEDKNRYSNVLPLPETRVPLKRLGNDPTTEYINANYIMGPGNIRNYYIACQAPLSNTVTDFWRMIWEQNSRLIIMLTEYMENGTEKCYEYLPPSEISDNKRTFGEYQIILKKREQRDKYAISSVQLINLATRTWREVTHLWYFWPAKGVPDDYDSVIDFLSEMRSYMKISQTAKEYDEEGVEVIYQDQSRSSYHNLAKLRDENGSGNGVNVYSPAKAEEMMRRTNGTLGRMKAASEVESVRPCTVVCASGAGRSCAVVAAELCARALAGGRADVPRVVRRLRDQRPHALANRHHYVFLYKLLSEYGNRLMGGGMDTI